MIFLEFASTIRHFHCRLSLVSEPDNRLEPCLGGGMSLGDTHAGGQSYVALCNLSDLLKNR
jgi:hypothetical protein